MTRVWRWGSSCVFVQSIHWLPSAKVLKLLADLEALGEDEHGAPRKAVAVSLLLHPRSPEASRGMAER